MIARGIRVPRRGISLIEMMVVISSLAILLGLSAVMIQLLLRLGSDAQARRSAAASLGRLAEQFRADVHASEAAEIRPAAGLRLKLDRDVVVDYELRTGRIARVESTGGQAVRHESYVLGRHDNAVFERREDGPRRFLALVIAREGGPGVADPPHPLEILALVGKDRTGPPSSGGGKPR